MIGSMLPRKCMGMTWMLLLSVMMSVAAPAAGWAQWGKPRSMWGANRDALSQFEGDDDPMMESLVTSKHSQTPAILNRAGSITRNLTDRVTALRHSGTYSGAPTCVPLPGVGRDSIKLVGDKLRGLGSFDPSISMTYLMQISESPTVVGMQNPYVRVTRGGCPAAQQDPGLPMSMELKLALRIARSPGHLQPADVYGMAVEACHGDHAAAALTAHNLLKEIAYAARAEAPAVLMKAEEPGAQARDAMAQAYRDLLGPGGLNKGGLSVGGDGSRREISIACSTLSSKLENLRLPVDENFDDKMGPWYHIFAPIAISAVSPLGAVDGQYCAKAEGIARDLHFIHSPLDPFKQAVTDAAGDSCFLINETLKNFVPLAKSPDQASEPTASLPAQPLTPPPVQPLTPPSGNGEKSSGRRESPVAADDPQESDQPARIEIVSLDVAPTDLKVGESATITLEVKSHVGGKVDLVIDSAGETADERSASYESEPEEVLTMKLTETYKVEGLYFAKASATDSTGMVRHATKLSVIKPESADGTYTGIMQLRHECGKDEFSVSCDLEFTVAGSNLSGTVKVHNKSEVMKQELELQGIVDGNGRIQATFVPIIGDEYRCVEYPGQLSGELGKDSAGGTCVVGKGTYREIKESPYKIDSGPLIIALTGKFTFNGEPAGTWEASKIADSGGE